MTPNEIQKIKERFINQIFKAFHQPVLNDQKGLYEYVERSITDFLSQSLTAERERLWKEVGEKKKMEHDSYSDCRKSGGDCFIEGCENWNYNQALTDAQNIIKFKE